MHLSTLTFLNIDKKQKDFDFHFKAAKLNLQFHAIYNPFFLIALCVDHRRPCGDGVGKLGKGGGGGRRVNCYHNRPELANKDTFFVSKNYRVCV